MSRLKFVLAGLVAAVAFGFAAPPDNALTPVPMPLYKGVYRGTSLTAPQPHREETYKKWLIPVVRIRVPGAAGSGTICYYDKTKNTAYVISCAHLFMGGNREATIEVFYKNDKKLAVPAKFRATVLSVKTGYYEDDISLMSFQPDWTPEAWFPIAAENHPILRGEQYFSSGCDNASEVACYLVRPLGIDDHFLATTENSPRPGRSGGGLMDKDGWYVGICVRTSDVSGNGTGYFVHLKTIHDYFRKNDLAWLLNLPHPNRLIYVIPVVDRTETQGTYPSDYVPLP